MRLLNVHSLRFSELYYGKPPSYVIASHRWTGDETPFEEIEKDPDRRSTDTSGYRKILGFSDFVRRHLPHVEWLWIDTCCINKKDPAELSEAIISMFKWYRQAEVCLAYLADVESNGDAKEFKRSVWFCRGWTLQELLAPATVIFLTSNWDIIGHKGRTGRGIGGVSVNSGPSLTDNVVAASRIPKIVLDDFGKTQEFTVTERLAWMEGRTTTHEEDMTYSLLGIFDVSMPVLYGEGGKRARARLLAEINQLSDSKQRAARDWQSLVDWLSAPDPWTNHSVARQHHHADTGSWLLQSDRYQRWKSDSIRHLWLSGKPGCGKTVLCSSVIQDIRPYCSTDTDMAYAAFYFSFTDTRKQSYEDFLRSLVAQLGMVEPSRWKLQQAYEKTDRKLPQSYELVEILLLAIASYGKVFVLIDALDECAGSSTDNSQRNVLDLLHRLSQEAPNVKIFATSREILAIGDSMDGIDAGRITAASGEVDLDIRNFVSNEMSRNSTLRRLPESSKKLVADTLSTRANGMYVSTKSALSSTL